MDDSQIDDPHIGIDKLFFRNITSDISITAKCEDSQFPSSLNLCCNEENSISRYKINKCLVLYDEDEIFKPFTSIDELKLFSILNIDNAPKHQIRKDTSLLINRSTKILQNKSELEFESRFECGNLRMVIQTSENEFDLILRNDYNAGKYAQWFFFEMRVDMKSPKKLKFSIINCEKPHIIFNNMKVLFYSKNLNIWKRLNNTDFFCNNFLTGKKLYTLSFEIEISQSLLKDTLYFSYCYPYSYSDLQNFIRNLSINNKKTNFLHHEILMKTQSGNNLDMLLISNFNSNFDDIANRPAVILTSRIHPGESNSSFIIQSIIEYLLSKSRQAEILRNKYIFKIIPMLNPDGVIHGNYRTCISGLDLNRTWMDPKDDSTIFHVKEMVKRTSLSRKLFFYCDFHGHANKYNQFIYGCPMLTKQKSLQEMVFSRILSTKCDFFDNSSSTYKITKSKMKTGRAVMRNEFLFEFSYCLEASIMGINIGNKRNTFFTKETYSEIGVKFIESFYEGFGAGNSYFNNVLNNLRIEEIEKKVKKENKKEDEKKIVVKKKGGMQKSLVSSGSINSEKLIGRINTVKGNLIKNNKLIQTNIELPKIILNRINVSPSNKTQFSYKNIFGKK